VVDGGEASLVLAPFEQRRLEHPAELPSAVGHERQALRHAATEPVERDGTSIRRVGDDQDQVAVARAGGRRRRRELLGRQMLLDGRAERPVLAGDPHEPGGAAATRLGHELVELAARQRRAARRGEPLDLSAVGERRGEGTKARADEGAAEVRELHPVAQVRLVGPEPREHLVVGHPRKRRLHVDAAGLAEELGHERLD
jgi:hypothetical protein